MKTTGVYLEKKLTDSYIDNNIASNDMPQDVMILQINNIFIKKNLNRLIPKQFFVKKGKYL